MVLRYLAPIVLSVFAPTSVSAADVTAMPPALGGSARLSYGLDVLFGGLEEGEERIGSRRFTRHDVNYLLEFAPVAGVAVILELSHTPSLRHRFPSARSMIYEPVTGSGTYLFGTPEAEDPLVAGSGINGLWMGAAVAPFSEAYDRPQPTSWRLEAGWRTGSPRHNLWTARNGRRGTAPGGSAFRLSGAFSSRSKAADPYLQVEYIHENPVTVDLIDEDETTWATGVELRPASTLEILGGTELIGFEDAPTHRRVAADLFLGFGYRSWEDVASGVYLPNVLDSSRTIAVTTGDHVMARVGTGLDVQFDEHFRARSTLDLGYATPFAPEHVYAVRTTPGSFTIGWTLAFTGQTHFTSP